VELDGVMQVDDEIPLSDESRLHEVRVVLGEKTKPEADESKSEQTADSKQ
jgi:hypothetical protein